MRKTGHDNKPDLPYHGQMISLCRYSLIVDKPRFHLLERSERLIFFVFIEVEKWRSTLDVSSVGTLQKDLLLAISEAGRFLLILRLTSSHIFLFLWTP